MRALVVRVPAGVRKVLAVALFTVGLSLLTANIATVAATGIPLGWSPFI